MDNITDAKVKMVDLLIPSLNDLIDTAIERTPSLTPTDLQVLAKKKRKIARLIDNFLFPPLDLSFISSRKGLSLSVTVISIVSIAVIFDLEQNRISIIGQLALAYFFAVIGSWCVYYLGIVIGRNLGPAFGVFLVIGAVCSFVALLLYWLSPHSPLHANPEVVSTIRSAAGTDAERALVSGQALLPPNTHLWILVGKGDQWWPLREAEINRRSGQWRVNISDSDVRHIGCDSVVAVTAVSGDVSRSFGKYVEASDRFRLAPSIALPYGTSVIQIFDLKLPNCRDIDNRQVPSSSKRRKSDGNLIVPVTTDFWPDLTPDRKDKDEQTLTNLGSRTDLSAYKERGRAYSELGDQDAAEACFNQSILHELDSEGLNGRGLARLRKGRLNEALEDFENAHKLEPTNATYALNVDSAENIAEDVEPTLKYLNAVLLHRPSDGEVYFRLGLAYKKHGDLALARDALNQAANFGGVALKQKATVELRSFQNQPESSGKN